MGCHGKLLHLRWVWSFDYSGWCPLVWPPCLRDIHYGKQLKTQWMPGWLNVTLFYRQNGARYSQLSVEFPYIRGLITIDLLLGCDDRRQMRTDYAFNFTALYWRIGSMVGCGWFCWKRKSCFFFFFQFNVRWIWVVSQHVSIENECKVSYSLMLYFIKTERTSQIDPLKIPCTIQVFGKRLYGKFKFSWHG